MSLREEDFHRQVCLPLWTVQGNAGDGVGIFPASLMGLGQPFRRHYKHSTSLVSLTVVTLPA